MLAKGESAVLAGASTIRGILLFRVSVWFELIHFCVAIGCSTHAQQGVSVTMGRWCVYECMSGYGVLPNEYARKPGAYTSIPGSEVVPGGI